MQSLFGKDADEIQKKYSEYYDKMKTSIDYINKKKSELNWHDNEYKLKFKYLSKKHPFLFKDVMPPSKIFNDLRIAHFRLTIVEPLLNELPNHESKKLENIWVDMFPLLTPNARCFKIPDADIPIVVIHDSIIGLLSYYPEIQYIFARLYIMNKKVGDIFLSYSFQKILDFFTKKTGNLPLFDLNAEVKYMLTMKACAQELFLVAHEFSHIILDHLENYRTFYISHENKKINFEEYSLRKKMEFEADIQAVKWLNIFKTKALKSESLKFAMDIRFPLEIFALFHTIETNLMINPKNHPTSVERVNYIYQQLKNDLNLEEKTFIEEMFRNFKLGFKFKKLNLSKKDEDDLLRRINKMIKSSII